MTDDDLVAAFEAGEIDGSAFPHESHVRVAWGLARRYPRADALRRLTEGIRRIAERAGRPAAYHETITRAWFELVASADELERHPELFDKALLGRYYSSAALAGGRDRWVEPDLRPLRLPAPQAPAPTELAVVLRGIPTAVAILAVRTSDTVHATTVSSLTSVSREPALVSVCLADGSRALELVRAAGAFALSLLAADQDDVAEQFADPSRPAGAAQFGEVHHRLDAFGPVIDGASAWIGCRVHAIRRCGDHDIVVGQVSSAERSGLRPSCGTTAPTTKAHSGSTLRLHPSPASPSRRPRTA
jgi:flavin reductase (DIM6/NTAB) family NADH-FMN oxidoreductase RutF